MANMKNEALTPYSKGVNIYKFLAESMNDILWIMDMSLCTTYVSPSIEKVLGFTPAERMAQTIQEQLTPDSLVSVAKVMESELANENDPKTDPNRIIKLELEYYHKDGTTRWLENVIGGIRDGEGNLNGLHGLSRDITERKRTEEEHRKNLEIYELLANNMVDAVAIFDLQMRVVFVSPSILRLRGYTPEEAAFQTLDQILTPSSLGNALSVLEQELERVAAGDIQKERSVILDLETYKKDGSVILVENRLSFLWDQNEKPFAILAVGRDVTKQRRAENDLRERQEIELSILLSVPHALVGVEQRRIFFANDATEQVFGWKPDELIGQSTRVVFRNDSEWERYGDLLYSRLKEEPLVVFEWDNPFVKRDGSEIFCRTSVSRVGKGLGKTGKIVATFEEITERKRAEEALQESERTLSNIIEFLPDATLVIDKEGKIIAWNRAIEAMTGVKKQDMIGKGNYEYALPFYGERRSILIDLALRSDANVEKKYTTIQRTGDILFGEAHAPNLPPGNIQLSASASVLRNSKGEIVGAIECVRNNTERKNLEERLQQARKMEAVGLLAGGVAHDLNNMLGVLVGYAELILHEIDKDSRFRKHAQSILTAGERAAAIVQDMLALARRGVQTSEVVDLNRIVSEFLRSPECDKLRTFHQHCRIKTKRGDDLLRIKGSPVHLAKVLANVVFNAAESMPQGGEIVISTENRYLEKPLRGYVEVNIGDYVILSVADTGQGIPDKDKRRIFEPFYTKKAMGHSGTGLGLAVVWGVMQDHDGYIDIKTQLGKGTTFDLYFPATREELTENANIPISSFMGKGEKILVVDDVKGQRELAAHMLGNLGYQVTTIECGESAVEYLKTNKPDLVILDMIMDPGMDGLDTYKKIIEIHPNLKTLIVSGYAETTRVHEAQRLGAGAYVRKPYILERIGCALRKELDKAT